LHGGTVADIGPQRVLELPELFDQLLLDGAFPDVHPFPPDRAFPADTAVTLSQPLSLAAGQSAGQASPRSKKKARRSGPSGVALSRWRGIRNPSRPCHPCRR